MYFLNVVHLKQFYASALGKKVQEALLRCLQKTWPQMAQGETMLAIGYPMPFLPEVESDNTIVVCMPAEQGALCWPAQGLCRTFLGSEAQLPIPDSSVNRVLLCHTFECTAQMREMMQEIWRILTPSGRMVAFVPNRMSLWSHSQNSPFGYGRPYSAHQIHEVMKQSELTCLRLRTALYFFPLQVNWLLKLARVMEALFGFLLPMCGGVWIVEAEKQIYASIKQPVATKKPQGIPIGVVQPTT